MDAEYAKRVNRDTDIRVTVEDAGKLLTIAQDTLQDELTDRRIRTYQRLDALNVAWLQTR
jgi:predicted HTH domain antitoxin